MTGRRSDILLGALGAVAIANGVFLGLSVYGLLAAGLHLLGSSVPGVNWALALGAVAGVALLGEAALAPPTALALSRLVSRARVFESDARGAELGGNRAALAAALRKLEQAPPTWDDARLERRRFALLVAPRERSRYRTWLARIYATHPSLSSRIEELEQPQQRRRAAQDDSRAPLPAS